MSYGSPTIKSIFGEPDFHVNANYGDTGMPHDTLTEYIEELKAKLNEIYVAADDARAELGHVRHPKLQDMYDTCPLCQAKAKLDDVLVLANLTVRL